MIYTRRVLKNLLYFTSLFTIVFSLLFIVEVLLSRAGFSSPFSNEQLKQLRVRESMFVQERLIWSSFSKYSMAKPGIYQDILQSVDQLSSTSSAEIMEESDARLREKESEYLALKTEKIHDLSSYFSIVSDIIQFEPQRELSRVSETEFRKRVQEADEGLERIAQRLESRYQKGHPFLLLLEDIELIREEFRTIEYKKYSNEEKQQLINRFTALQDQVYVVFQDWLRSSQTVGMILTLTELIQLYHEKTS